MGQIAASDNYSIPSQKFCRLFYTRSQLVMFCKRKTRQADPHQAVIGIILVQKIQRHHGSVIQTFIPLPQRARRDVSCLCFLRQHPDKFCVILCLKLCLRRTEPGETSPGALSR